MSVVIEAREIRHFSIRAHLALECRISDVTKLPRPFSVMDEQLVAVLAVGATRSCGSISFHSHS